MGEVLFEDIFTIYAIDKEGKKFDKVSRIEARSEQFDMHMTLDVNIDVYPVAVGEKFTVAMATTLNLDGTPDTGYYVSGRKTLADKYEYVMYGKLYKIDESHESGANAKVEIYVSYGGLLMLLKGEPSHMNFFQLDQRLFFLMRKVW